MYIIKLEAIAVLVIFMSSCISGYNINHEQSTVYKDAIAKTLNKQPLITPIKYSATGVVPFVPTPCPIKSKAKLAGPPNYWFHPKIHTFGNTGILGAIHAALAPLVTMLIDVAAYEGENIRVKIGRGLRDRVGKTGANVVDMCCGVGISTRALRKAFVDANTIIGVDTSPEMIAMAQVLANENLVAKLMKSHDPTLVNACHSSYSVRNAERTFLPKASFNLVTIMYGFHEIPFLGRYRILREARRLLAPGGTLAIVDISPEYTPSPNMLAGEPYVKEYQANIHRQLEVLQGFERCEYENVVPGHVGTWLLTRNTGTAKDPKRVLEISMLRP